MSQDITQFTSRLGDNNNNGNLFSAFPDLEGARWALEKVLNHSL